MVCILRQEEQPWDGRTYFSIRPIIQKDRKQIEELAEKHWGEKTMVVHGEKYDITKLPGYLADDSMRIIGFVTFNVVNETMEIISLDSFEENHGVGSDLLATAIRLACAKKMERLHVTTTNDNLRALEFYQKRGFSLTKLRVGAVNEARKLKPSIPLQSTDGITIEHELELDYCCPLSAINDSI